MKFDVSRIVRFLKQFLHWWSGELIALRDDCVNKLTPRWSRSLSIVVTKTEILMCKWPYRDGSVIIKLSRSSHSQQQIATMPEEFLPILKKCTRARLFFHPDLAYIQTVTLPLAALPHLHSAIKLQLQKLLPIDPATTLTAIEFDNDSWTDKLFSVRLAALKRSDVNPVIEQINDLDLRVTKLQLGDSFQNDTTFRFHLEGDGFQQKILSTAQRKLVSIMALLTLVIFSISTVQSWRTGHSIEQAYATTAVNAANALMHRNQLNTSLMILRELQQLQRAPDAPAVLMDITKNLPKDSWLTHFDLRNHELKLAGITPEPAVLVKSLSDSQFLSKVQLKSFAANSSNPAQNRFEVSAAIRGSIQ